MAKRKKGRSHLDTDLLKSISSEGKKKSNLPDPDDVDKSLHKVTPGAKTKYGRPPKKASIGRKKFTTYVKEDLIKKLKQKALDNDITAADLLEKILSEYLGRK